MKTLADARTLAGIVARLERVVADSPRRWGSMSAHQMLVHLTAASEVALGRASFPRTRRPPSRLIKLYGLYVPIRWPHGIRVGARPAEVVVDAGLFAADRMRAIASARELAAATPSSLPSFHPLFGTMSTRDWQRWGYLHADHHLRQFGL